MDGAPRDGRFAISGREIGEGHPTFIIAEISANHGHDIAQARALISAAKESGADAVKLQTYTADTLTIPCDNEFFRLTSGTVWDGRTLYDLYKEAYTPWEWHAELKSFADYLGLILFSTPFDTTAVDFLEELEVPAYKVASFEIVDLPLLAYIGSKKKPVIVSTGMATLEEIEEAVETLRTAGANGIAILKCTSGYPASPDEMNLRSIPALRQRFGVQVGLSDHTLGHYAATASVCLGATIIEKHFTMDRSVPGPDSAFSLEPAEFAELVDNVHNTERALGNVFFGCSAKEAASRVFRRSLFVVEPIKKGEQFTARNVRSIRPGYGLAPKHLPAIVGKSARIDIARGTPLAWDLIVEQE